MTRQEPPTGADGGTSVQRTADRLALALEDVGFDVGRAFPMLRSGTNRDGAPFVELGTVTEAVASGLATVLSEAARLGVTL